jgi:GTPase Era involved in 16S rRNA processing
VPVANKYAGIGVNGPGLVLDRKWRDKHLSSRIVDVIDECDFLVFHVNYQHVVHNHKAGQAITRQLYYYLLLCLIANSH